MASLATSDLQPEELDRLAGAIRDVNDFPKPGIVFKDITPVLSDPGLFDLAMRALNATFAHEKVDKIIGIDARGFIFAAVMADRRRTGFIPVRKIGKLPWQTHMEAYELEYGEARIEIHKDAILPGERVLLVDDLLATGGTAAAALNLVSAFEGRLVGAAFLIELAFLNGRQRLGSHLDIRSVLTY